MNLKEFRLNCLSSFFLFKKLLKIYEKNETFLLTGQSNIHELVLFVCISVGDNICSKEF